MLRISKLADYATVIMTFLAHHHGQSVSARDIAVGTHLGLPTVSKILKRLTAANLLVSIRGASGGYRLKYQAENISVSDILYALDEPRGLTACTFNPDACALHSVCHIQDNWRRISQFIESVLAHVSLATLASPVLTQDKLNQIKGVTLGG